MNEPLFKMLRTPSRLRITLTLLSLLACTVQSFVAQTHVHAPRAETHTNAGYHTGDRLDAASILSPSDDGPTKHVRRDGSSSCPLCQIVLHGGAAPAPTFPLFLPLQTAISVARYEPPLPGRLVAVSFSWQSRAPPLT